MKHLFMIFIFFLVSIYSNELAVTDKGKVVILNSDGTWKYAQGNKTLHSPNKKSDVILENKSIFTKGHL